MIPGHRQREPGAPLQRETLVAAASCTPSAPGPASAASASSTVIGASVSAASVSSSIAIAAAPTAPCVAALTRRGGRTLPARPPARRAARRRSRARRPSVRWRCPSATASAKHSARDGLHQHEPAEQGEVFVPRQPAPGEVAGGVGERADDQHVVQRGVAVEQLVDELFVQRQRDGQEHEREARLDRDRHAQRVLCRVRAPCARRSCARAAVRSAGRSPR